MIRWKVGVDIAERYPVLMKEVFLEKPCGLAFHQIGSAIQPLRQFDDFLRSCRTAIQRRAELHRGGNSQRLPDEVHGGHIKIQKPVPVTAIQALQTIEILLKISRLPVIDFDSAEVFLLPGIGIGNADLVDELSEAAAGKNRHGQPFGSGNGFDPGPVQIRTGGILDVIGNDKDIGQPHLLKDKRLRKIPRLMCCKYHLILSER